MANKSLIIFDCDGVLVDSEIISNQADADVFRSLGLTLDAEYLIEHYSGRPKYEIWQDIAQQYDLTIPEGIYETTTKNIIDRFQDELQAVVGMHDLIANLNHPICVASSSEMKKLRYALTLTNLIEYFDPHIFSATQVKQGKPAPDLFLFAAATMGVAPENCLVVEDSRAGVLAAKNASMDVIGFTAGAHSYKNHGNILLSAGAIGVAGSAFELNSILHSYLT